MENIPTNHMYIIFLAFIYTIVCAFRSFWLRKDVEQTCFFDSKISTTLIGRTLATIAEICYTLLIMTVLTNITKDISKLTNEKLDNSLFALRIILPIIIIAEIFSWFGSISKYYLWNAAEETLWMTCGMIVISVCLLLYSSLKKNPNLNPNFKSISSFLRVFVIATSIFVIFMIKTDIPMYYDKWKASDKNNDNIVSLGEFIDDFKNKNTKLTYQNFLDLNRCKRISKDFNVWVKEIPWLSAYFTFGVWSSIGMVMWYINYSKNI
jgi:hypothetical protein